MKKVLIVTDLSFPSGSAMASRILSFAHIFNELEYGVHVITAKYEGKEYISDKVYDNDFYSFEIVSSKREYRVQTFLGNENLGNRVDNYLSKNDVDFVFCTSLNMNFNNVYKVCRKYNKKIILEQCEWYDSSSFRFNKFDPRYISFNKNITRKYFDVDGVISISRLLNDYYNENNVKSIRIPSILDIRNKRYRTQASDNKIKLVYTGNASKSKELIKPILEALNSDKKYDDLFTFDIYGINDKQLLNNIDNDQELLKTAKCHGFISQEKIEDVLMDADYQIFIRPDRRSSNAGFPTKLSESMAVGTPVICNYTGDIELYIKDSENGFIIDGTSKQDVTKVFDKIMNHNHEQLDRIRENARKTAEENFDYRLYKDLVKELISEI